MAVKSKEIVKYVTVFEASDGKTFTARRNAEEHEWALTAVKVYMVVYRNVRAEHCDIFTTLEAAEAVKEFHNKGDCLVTTRFLDPIAVISGKHGEYPGPCLEKSKM